MLKMDMNGPLGCSIMIFGTQAWDPIFDVMLLGIQRNRNRITIAAISFLESYISITACFLDNFFSPYAKKFPHDTTQKSFLEETYHDVKAREIYENQSDVQNSCRIPESRIASFYAECLSEKQMGEN